MQIVGHGHHQMVLRRCRVRLQEAWQQHLPSSCQILQVSGLTERLLTAAPSCLLATALGLKWTLPCR